LCPAYRHVCGPRTTSGVRLPSVFGAMQHDWHAIERLYVFGEVVDVRDDRSEVREFPTIRELAARLGTSRSVIGDRASNNGWAYRRRQFQIEFRNATWQKLAERELAGATNMEGG